MKPSPSKVVKAWTTADQPIEHSSEDTLDRRHFALSLVEAISQWSSPKSLIISLNAPWGLGKTSAKNLVLEYLTESRKEWSIVEFSPWQWSSYGQLADAFFDEIAVSLGKSSRKGHRELAANWRRYAAKLKGGSQLTTALIAPIKVLLFITASSLCGVGIIWGHRVFFGLAIVMLAVAMVSEWTSRVLVYASDFISPSTKDSEQSLDEIRSKVAENLTAMDGNVLVIVDDLDRLSPKNLADVIQLIKANGDLPRMLYLLIGDRQVISEHIGTELHVDGHKYMSKIIQISLDLPSAGQWKVHQKLFAGLNEMLAPQAISRRFAPVHWQEVFEPGLSSYFDSLRSVNRFLTTFEFHVGMFKANSSFEVNVVDLIAMETLRLFEPTLYSAIASRKSLLVSPASLRAPQKDFVQAEVERLLDCVSQERRAGASALLQALFPSLFSHLAGHSVGSDDRASWSRDLRVGSEKHFDKYFEFLLDPREISEGDIDNILASKSRSDFAMNLERLRKRSLLDKAVIRLREHHEAVSVPLIPEMVTALFDVGDFISSDAPAMFSLGPSVHSEFLVQSLLERLSAKSSVKDALLNSVKNTSGLCLPTQIVLKMVIKSKRGEVALNLSEEDLSELKSAILDKTKCSAHKGDLLTKRDARLLLYLWKEWGSLDDARTFVLEHCKSADGTISFLKSMVCTVHSSVPNKDGGSARHYIRMNDVNDFADPSLIKDMLASGLSNAVVEQNQTVLTLWQRAVERSRDGKPDDAFTYGDDDDL